MNGPRRDRRRSRPGRRPRGPGATSSTSIRAAGRTGSPSRWIARGDLRGDRRRRARAEPAVAGDALEAAQEQPGRGGEDTPRAAPYSNDDHLEPSVVQLAPRVDHRARAVLRAVGEGDARTAASSSRSLAGLEDEARRAIAAHLGEAQPQVAEEPPAAPVRPALRGRPRPPPRRSRCRPRSGRAAVEASHVDAADARRPRGRRAPARAAAGGAGRGRGRCRSPPGTIPSAAAEPSRPRATSLTVPSPPTAITSSAPAADRLAGELGGVPGLPGHVDRVVAPRGPSALDRLARAVAATPARGFRIARTFTRPPRARASVSSTMRSAVKRSRKRRRPAAPRARAPLLVAEDLGQGLGEGRGVPRGRRRGRSRRPPPPPGSRRRRWPPPGRPNAMASSRLVPEPLEVGREAEDRERRQEPVEVAAEAREDHAVARGPRSRTRASSARPQLALAGDHEPRLGGARPEQRHGLDQRGVVLVAGERRHVAHDRGPGGHAELGEGLPPPRLRRAVGDALVDEPQPRRGERRRSPPPSRWRGSPRSPGRRPRTSPRERAPRRGKSTRRTATSGAPARRGGRDEPGRDRVGVVEQQRRPGRSRRRTRASARMAGRPEVAAKGDRPHDRGPRPAPGPRARRPARQATRPSRPRARPCPARSAGPGSGRRARWRRCPGAGRAGSSLRLAVRARARGAWPA